jgi:hypothetical protein
LIKQGEEGLRRAEVWVVIGFVWRFGEDKAEGSAKWLG